MQTAHHPCRSATSSCDTANDSDARGSQLRGTISPTSSPVFSSVQGLGILSNGVFRSSSLPRRGTTQFPNASPAPRDDAAHDRMFGVILDALLSLFKMNCLDKPEITHQILQAFEALLQEHFENPQSSRLRSVIPEIKLFFTPLPFAAAFDIYNRKYRVTKRLFIPPTFHEIRHVTNIAQVMAVEKDLRLISFDGDETLYADGRNFDDPIIAHYITTLLCRGCAVAVVTAAGYGYQIEKYEIRLQGLLDYFKERKLHPSVVRSFFVFGGESNYMIRCGVHYRLEPIPEQLWRSHVSPQMKVFFAEDELLSQLPADADQISGQSEIRRLLNVAKQEFDKTIQDLSLRAAIVVKERAVGLVPGGAAGRLLHSTGSGMSTIKTEILEEAVFRVRKAIQYSTPPIMVPFCAFNGGREAWVDVGNKAEGLRVLQSFLNIQPSQCLHIGDQFSISGNDIAARDVAPTLWICNPSETKAVLRSLWRQLNHSSLHVDDFEVDHVESDTDRESQDDFVGAADVAG